MFDYACKSIAKRWVRSILMILGIAALLSLVIVVTGIINYQKKTMNQHASAGGAGRIIIQSYTAGSHYPTASIDLKENIVNDLLEIDLIQRDISVKTLFFALRDPLYPSEPPELLLCGLEKGKEKGFTGNIANETRIDKGRLEISGENEVVIGYRAANLLTNEQNAIQVGATLEILNEDFTIIGILEESNDKVVNNSLIVSLSKAQDMFDKNGFISSLILYTQKVEERDEMIGLVEEFNNKLSILTSQTLSRNANEGIRLFENMINSISIVVIVVAVLLIMTVMIITIKERTSEIGLLRIIGTKNSTLIKTILYEIFIISFLGSILACILSSIILRYFLMENLFDFIQIIKYIPVSLLLTLFSGAIPVINILKIKPIEALKYE